jgi:hypothetical protein
MPQRLLPGIPTKVDSQAEEMQTKTEEGKVMNAIYDGFKDWQDVVGEFSGPYEWSGESKKNAASKQIPEPEQVIVAAYTYEDYSGDAWVVYRDQGKYYTVDGGHCSCYGLEGQWEPEEYESAEALLAALKKGNWYYGVKKSYAQTVIEALEAETRNRYLTNQN